jgi:hypothetical protein
MIAALKIGGKLTQLVKIGKLCTIAEIVLQATVEALLLGKYDILESNCGFGPISYKIGAQIA